MWNILWDQINYYVNWKYIFGGATFKEKKKKKKKKDNKKKKNLKGKII